MNVGAENVTAETADVVEPTQPDGGRDVGLRELFGEQNMHIPGMPDEDLVRLHWNYGGGRGTVGYRHIPSGIMVTRECLPDVPVRLFYQEALTELERILREKHLIREPRQD